LNSIQVQSKSSSVTHGKVHPYPDLVLYLYIKLVLQNAVCIFTGKLLYEPDQKQQSRLIKHSLNNGFHLLLLNTF